MSAKIIFTLSDVAAISARMSRNPIYNPTSSAFSHAPASPIAAKIMRDIGVSHEKMTQAFRLAITAVAAQK